MAKLIATGINKLRFMKDQEFEDEAALLLAEYSNQHGQVVTPPIPIDEIVELYLQLQLEFKNMQQLFGVDDVHGALWVNERRVGIDERLDPAQHHSMLGRYRFTLAHEAGHWRLHRQLFQKKANQLKLLPEGADRPEYICRSSDNEPIEYQANRFASCLLMPREMVKRVWHECRLNMEPIYLEDLRCDNQMMTLIQSRSNTATSENDDLLLAQVSRPLADRFQVSPDAMRIRLEGLNLLQRKKERTLF
jgi:IrrE N-terminal-like domain